MGETIQFPDEYQRYLLKANQLMDQGEYLSAASYFERAYRLAPSFAVNYAWVRSLIKQEAFDQALAITDEWYHEYFEHPEGFVVYAQILMLSRRFLKARKYLLGKKNAGYSDEAVLEELFQQLSQLENVQQLIDPESVLHKRRLLKQLDGAIGAITQNDWDVLTQNITYRSFVSLLGEFLPNVKNPFVRPRLVEELVKLDCGKIFIIQDFEGHERECQPNLLTLPENSETLRKMVRHVEETLGQDDPALSEAIIAEIRAHAAIAFPFLPQDDQPEKWAESYVLEYEGMFGNQQAQQELENYQEIQKQKQRYRQIFQQLI